MALLIDLHAAYEVVWGFTDMHSSEELEAMPVCEMPPLVIEAVNIINEHRRFGLDPSSRYGRG